MPLRSKVSRVPSRLILADMVSVMVVWTASRSAEFDMRVPPPALPDVIADVAAPDPLESTVGGDIRGALDSASAPSSPLTWSNILPALFFLPSCMPFLDGAILRLLLASIARDLRYFIGSYFDLFRSAL